MIKTLKNFFVPSVDGIVGSLTRTVEKLDKHQAKKAAQADRLHEKTDRYMERAEAVADIGRRAAQSCEAEALKAYAQANKLRKLLA